MLNGLSVIFFHLARNNEINLLYYLIHGSVPTTRTKQTTPVVVW